MSPKSINGDLNDIYTVVITSECDEPCCCGSAGSNKDGMVGKKGNNENRNAAPRSRMLRVIVAAFYGIISFLITITNKIVLTKYKFPSVELLALLQALCSVVCIALIALFGLIRIRLPELNSYVMLIAIGLLSFLNLTTGLASTRNLSLPIFIAMRRFSILFTLILEYILLRKKATTPVCWAVALMIGGAVVAASYDLTFSAFAFSLVLINDVATSLNSVLVKRLQNMKSTSNGEILFFNCLFTSVCLSAHLSLSGKELAEDLNTFKGSGLSVNCMVFLALSCMMGVLLNYSILLCTHHNSALATTVIGALKNILITYLGMYIGGDYVFTSLNFLGLNISLSGSVMYAYTTFFRSERCSAECRNGDVCGIVQEKQNEYDHMNKRDRRHSRFMDDV